MNNIKTLNYYNYISYENNNIYILGSFICIL